MLAKVRSEWLLSKFCFHKTTGLGSGSAS